MIRRTMLLGGVAVVLAARTGAAESEFEIMRSDKEWKGMLSDQEYKVMRRNGTERAFSSPLNDEKGTGLYHCRGCDLALYSSETKFDSGTGWPSFWQPLSDAVATRPDRSFFMVRTEVHCRRCGSHLGHIFDDGPPPTGKRHCLNGASLVFRPPAT